MSPKRLLFTLTISPLLLGILLLFVPFRASSWSSISPQAQAQQVSDHIEPEQLVYLLQYLGTDYGVAVEAGRVISEVEYQEMLDFSQVVVDEYESQAAVPEILPDLKRLRLMIQGKAEREQVQELVRDLIPRLSKQFSVISYPTVPPSISRGGELFARDCAKCHGVNGDGNGPSAPEMDPQPTSFRDERMNRLPPYQVFNAVTFGVQGTEMASHLESLSDRERWDIAFFVMTMRNDFDPSSPPQSLNLSLRDLSSYSAEELITLLEKQGLDVHLKEVDFYRSNLPGASLPEFLELARSKLEQSLQAYRKGNLAQALKLTLSAYLMGVEPVELALIQRDNALKLRLESQFSVYRGAIRRGGPPEVVGEAHRSLLRLAKQAQKALLQQPQTAWGFTLVQSLAIILREGIEAALLLGLMLTYVAATGHRWLRKYLVVGAAAGVLLGMLTWWATEVLLGISRLQQEVLEGFTSLLAAAVLFSVSFWMIQSVDVRHWKEYMRRKTEQAMSKGSGLILASAAFLAVYREAVETVLFYQALWASHGSPHTAILLGFAAGSVLLVALVVLMFKFGLRIPIKQFFITSGVCLGILATVFAGYGVRELQMVGWIKETHLYWMIHTFHYWRSGRHWRGVPCSWAYF